jgi:hypothetical protein
MKTTLALVGAALLLAASGLAGPDVIIRERAKELRDQNNVRQGVAPPSQGATPVVHNPAATLVTTSPALARLQADLAAIKAGAQVTPAQKQRLTQDLLAVAQGAKPGATAPKLAEDLSAAFAERPLSASSRARLVQEIDAVLNPAKYPQAKMEGIFADVQAVFQAREDNPMASQARKQAQVISGDVKAMAAEVRGGGVR